MKTKRVLFTIVLLLVLSGGLAWEFWPRGDTGAGNSSLPSLSPHKIAGTTSGSQPPAVEAPKLPAVNPALSAPSKTQPDRAAISAAGGSIEPVSVTYANNQTNMDFGEVALTPGVPVHLTLPTGQKGTMTASVAADGRMQVDVDIQGVAPGGQSNMMHGVAMGDGRTVGRTTQGNGEINISYSAKLSGN